MLQAPSGSGSEVSAESVCLSRQAQWLSCLSQPSKRNRQSHGRVVLGVIRRERHFQICLAPRSHPRGTTASWPSISSRHQGRTTIRFWHNLCWAISGPRVASNSLSETPPAAFKSVRRWQQIAASPKLFRTRAEDSDTTHVRLHSKNEAFEPAVPSSWMMRAVSS